MHSAIKKFYTLTIKQNRKFEYITYAKKEKKIPLVIDVDELVSMIDKIENKKTQSNNCTYFIRWIAGFRSFEFKAGAY